MAKFMVRSPNVKDLQIEVQHVDPSRYNRVTTQHIHPQVELAIATKGRCYYCVDGKNYDLDTGDCIFVNAYHEHGTCFIPPEASIDIVYFRLSDFDTQETDKISPSFLSFMNMPDFACRVFKNHVINSCVVSIVREFNEKKPYYSLLIRASMYTIIGMLYREEGIGLPDDVQKSEKLRKLQPLFEYINEHYQEHITLERAGEILFFNKSYLSRMFKEATGRNFSEYINEFKVTRSLEMLTGSDKTVIEISELLGFSSPTYFTAVFKRYYHCTPMTFRKKLYNINR